MKIKVKYFGLLAEAVNKSTEELELDANSTVLELQTLVKERYPKLQNKNFKVAVNQALVEGDVVLSEQDEIALLPPFAGG
jgi:molybdopterin synthase sulfur carrier subunit